MRRFLILGLLCFITTSALARHGAVRMRDGRTIEGDITEKDSEVVITTKAGSVTFSFTDVASISYGKTIQQQYQERLAALPKGAGAQSRVELARWLYEHKEYAFARAELDKALELDPNHADAFALKQAVERSMVWDRAKQSSASAPEGKQIAAAQSSVRDRPVLDADQINLIRQAELKETDRPRVRLDNDLRRRYIEHAGTNPAQFAMLPDGRKALEILKKGTPEMRRDVKILSDPAPLMRFKIRIQPILLNGCATAKCHGGSDAGRFVLYNPAANEAMTYTNYYILTQYNPNIGGAIRKSIDRQQPGDSLIIQFGLPRDQAQYPHPEVPGWTPLFRSSREARYREVMAWIQSLIPIAPNYGFAFELPGGSPVTEPDSRETPAADAPPADSNGRGAKQEPDGNRPEKEQEGGADERLKEIRERLRPIRGL